MKPDPKTHIVEFRLRAIQHTEQCGNNAACDAFQIARQTMCRWKHTLRAAGGRTTALISPNPERRAADGNPTTPQALIARIRALREQYSTLGKLKLRILLREFCAKQRLPLPSASTIDRTIARAPDKMRHAPTHIDRRG